MQAKWDSNYSLKFTLHPLVCQMLYLWATMVVQVLMHFSYPFFFVFFLNLDFADLYLRCKHIG